MPQGRARRFSAMAVGGFGMGERNEANSSMSWIEGCRNQLKQERFDAAEKAEEAAKKDKKDQSEAMVAAMKGFNSRLERVEKYRSELKIWSLIGEGKTEEARKLLEEAKDVPKGQRARLWHKLGD